MFSPLLCAALALAAPGDEPPDTPSITAHMEVFPKRLMLGDLVFVKITAFNHGKKAVPLPEWYDALSGGLLIQIGGKRSYRYFWRPGGFSIGPLGWPIPLMPLPPGEKRVVFFGAIKLPPIREIRRDFWTDMIQEKGWIDVQARLVHPKGETLRPFTSIEEIRPRPPEEIAAMTEAFAKRSPRSSPGWPTNPEKLAELVAKLSDGTLRDMLRARRLTQIIDADKAHPRGDASRRAAIEELIALLDESAELERQWLAFGIFKRHYRRSAALDQIEWELIKAVVEKVPDFLMNQNDGNGATYAERWLLIERRRGEKSAGAPTK